MTPLYAAARDHGESDTKPGGPPDKVTSKTPQGNSKQSNAFNYAKNASLTSFVGENVIHTSGNAIPQIAQSTVTHKNFANYATNVSLDGDLIMGNEVVTGKTPAMWKQDEINADEKADRIHATEEQDVNDYIKKMQSAKILERQLKFVKKLFKMYNVDFPEAQIAIIGGRYDQDPHVKSPNQSGSNERGDPTRYDPDDKMDDT
jgi:hypothetical protein